MPDTAVLEPPKPEVKAPETPPVTPPEQVGKTPVSVVLTGGLEGVLKRANTGTATGKPKKEAPAKAAEQPPVEKTPEQKAADEKPVEKAAEKVEEKPVEKKPDAPDTSLETNIVKLREAREAEATARKTAETERDAIRAQLEAAQKAGLPADVQEKLTSYETKLAEQQKVSDDLRALLRAASIERDPEFVERFQKGQQLKVNIMAQQAREAGIAEADIQAAFRAGNENAFGEWMEGMSPAQKAKFQGAWTGMLELQQQRNEAIQNADKEWEKMTAAQQARAIEAQKAARDAAERDAKGVLAEFFKIDGLPAEPEFRAGVEEAVMQAAGIKDGGDWTNQKWLTMVASNHALTHAVQSQTASIEALKAESAEKDKKIAELQAFVDAQKGAVPRGGAAGEVEREGAYVPLASRIRVAGV